MKFHTALLALGLGAVHAFAIAVPVQSSPTTTATACPTLCIDGITNCGDGWGGCYDICTETRPTAPECTKLDGPYYTITPTSYWKRDNLYKPTPTPSSDCSTRLVCADYINECGLMYGGCFADCLPWPTFTPPPCPPGWSSTTAATPPATPTYGDGEDCGRTICEDLVNECGVMYGGCHPDCAPYPTYTPPPCGCPHETHE